MKMRQVQRAACQKEAEPWPCLRCCQGSYLRDQRQGRQLRAARLTDQVGAVRVTSMLFRMRQRPCNAPIHVLQHVQNRALPPCAIVCTQAWELLLASPPDNAACTRTNKQISTASLQG